MSSPRQVAVIGAGLAGLAAARTLADAGIGVTVFEKSRGVGGRIATRREGEWAFDHGAQYATFRDPRMAQWVTSWAEAGVLVEWPARIAVREGGVWRESPDGPTRWVGAPGMSSLARHLARNLSVRLSTTIASATRAAAGWVLRDAAGTELGTYAALLVTAPAPQAAALLASNAPALAATCAEVVFHPTRAVLCVLEHPAEVGWDAAFVNDDAHVAWVARNAAKPGRDAGHECWVLHGTRAHSLATLEEDNEMAAAPMLASFARLLGSNAPRVVHAQGHRWRYAIPDPVLQGESVWDASLQAGLAGDWCGGPRVEGALLSGMALAGRVLGSPHG
jgi:renalase